MGMNKKEYSGLVKVFTFSFSQNLKSKMNIVITCILCMIAILSIPVMNLIVGYDKGEESQKTDIENVLLRDETGIGMLEGFQRIDNKKYASIHYQEDDRSIDEVKEIDGKNDVYLNLSYDAASGFSLFLIYDTQEKVSEDMAEEYLTYIEEHFREIAADATNIEKDTLTYLKKEVGTQIQMIGEKKQGDSAIGYSNFTMAMVCIITFVLALSGESIATSIATEKSTRVIEYLMVTIRPMALIIGKILASMSVVLLQLISTGICFGFSQLIFGNSSSQKIISDYLSSEMIKGISGVNIVSAIVIFFEGFLLFGLFAGLSGAAVSRIENIGEGMKLYSIILLIGAYISMFLPMTGKRYTFFCIFPITAPFYTPTYLLIGNVTPFITIFTMLVLACCILLLLKFVAMVYENMIFYNGQTLGLKEMIHLARNHSFGEGKGE